MPNQHILQYWDSKMVESKTLGKEGMMMGDLTYKIRNQAVTKIFLFLIFQTTNLAGRQYYYRRLAAG